MASVVRHAASVAGGGIRDVAAIGLAWASAIHAQSDFACANGGKDRLVAAPAAATVPIVATAFKALATNALIVWRAPAVGWAAGIAK